MKLEKKENQPSISSSLSKSNKNISKMMKILMIQN